MIKDPLIYIEDIQQSILQIEKYTKGIDKLKFSKDTKLQDAVIRRLEILGEATKNLPLSFRNKHPNIPWKEIAGMRDILIHAYSGVNIDRVWKVVVSDLIQLKKEINKITQ